jgi:hypothetical protein
MNILLVVIGLLMYLGSSYVAGYTALTRLLLPALVNTLHLIGHMPEPM